MGTMIRTRPRQMKAAVILGACEGVMPLSPQTEGLFSADEKEYFREKGFALGSLDDIKMDEENSAMYRMMSRPSEKIYISWSMTDAEGRDTNPSPVIDSLKTLFPRIEADGLIRKDIISTGRGETLGAGEPDRINTAGEGMRHLINRIKDPNAPEEPDALTRQCFTGMRTTRRDELDTMLKRRLTITCSVRWPKTAKDLFCRSGRQPVAERFIDRQLHRLPVQVLHRQGPQAKRGEDVRERRPLGGRCVSRVPHGCRKTDNEG